MLSFRLFKSERAPGVGGGGGMTHEFDSDGLRIKKVCSYSGKEDVLVCVCVCVICQWSHGGGGGGGGRISKRWECYQTALISVVSQRSASSI